jgi:hypothetical protein
MPHFYFHMRTDQDLVLDDEGIELSDIGVAREEALKTAREIMAGKIRYGSDDFPDAVVIVDQDGKEIASVALLDALPSRLRGR